MAERCYFCCYHDYRRKIAKLSDQEVGRLFRALLEYSETGETKELTGRESVAFDFIADDIDRAKESYREKCEKNRENGRKSIGSIGSERGRSVENGGVLHHKNEEQRTKNKEQKTNKNNIPPSPPAGGWGFGPILNTVFDDWLQYKYERKEPYKPKGLESLITQIKNKVDEFGEEAVIEVIRNSMANGWKGIIFNQLERRMPDGGGKYPSKGPAISADAKWGIKSCI